MQAYPALGRWRGIKPLRQPDLRQRGHTVHICMGLINYIDLVSLAVSFVPRAGLTSYFSAAA